MLAVIGTAMHAADIAGCIEDVGLHRININARKITRAAKACGLPALRLREDQGGQLQHYPKNPTCQYNGLHCSPHDNLLFKPNTVCHSSAVLTAHFLLITQTCIQKLFPWAREEGKYSVSLFLSLNLNR